MTDSERARPHLLARLREVLGDEEAATLMENLPPRPWSELATKDDLAALATKDDLAALASDVGVLKSDVGSLKSDVGSLRSEFVHLSDKLDLRFEAQDARLEALLRERIDSQTKMLLFSIIGALLTTAAIALGSAAL